MKIIRNLVDRAFCYLLNDGTEKQRHFNFETRSLTNVNWYGLADFLNCGVDEVAAKPLNPKF